MESLNRLKSLSVDAVAAHFGATSWLIKLWLRQGARVVHVSHGCDPSSGQHSVSVLIPLTERGRRLCEILEGKLQEELPELLSGPLADLAGDALRELLKAIECPKAFLSGPTRLLELRLRSPQSLQLQDCAAPCGLAELAGADRV